MKKESFISLVIAMIMIVSLVLTSCGSADKEPTDTSAAPTETTDTTASDEPIDEPVVEIPYIFTLDEDGWREYGIPSSFDLRSVDTDGDGVGDRCFVTKVKMQNPYGTCWGFAALAAAETSILGSVYLNDPDAYKTLDLSEKQFTYFVYLPLDDETNPQNGEGYIISADSYTSVYDPGGNSYLALSLFAQGIGLSEEYKEGNEIFIYRGANGYTEQRIVNGEFRNFCYSSEDDWSIPEEYRFKFDYILKDAIILPDPADYSSGEYEYNPEATEAIKLQLLLRRGVAIALYADSASPDDDDDKPGIYIDPFTWSHYTWEEKEADHVVTIVGWDDNYPKENFLEGHQPPENGAWLAKNSWGSGEEEFPNKGDGTWGVQVPLKDSNGNVMTDENGDPIMVGSGYFWISYYDMSINTPTAFVFEEKTAENDYVIDQHDYLPIFWYGYNYSDEEIKAANVFKASGPQILDAFSLGIPEDKLNVHYDVYLLIKDFTNPEEGLLVSSGDEYYDHIGFYRIKLDNQTIVQQGQYYSIVVTMTDEEGNYYTINTENYTSRYEPDLKTVVNEKESYFFNEGEWIDLEDYAEMLGGSISEDYPWVVEVDNYPIKGLSYALDEKMNIRLVDIADNEWNLYLAEDKNKTTVKIRFEGVPYREMGIPEIKWSFAEEDQNIISIEELKNGGYVRVTALNPGTVYLTVSIEGIGTTVARFDVHEYNISEIKVEDVNYEHDNMEADVSVFASNGELLTEGEDYTLVYTNNEKCGIAKVEIVPIGIELGEGVETVYYYAIYPPIPETESLTLVDGRLSGTFVDQFELGIDGYIVDYRAVGTDDWMFEFVESNKFDIAVEPDTDYEVTFYSWKNVTGMEMSDEMADLLYDEDDDAYYIYSDFASITVVEYT